MRVVLQFLAESGLVCERLAKPLAVPYGRSADPRDGRMRAGFRAAGVDPFPGG
jgi:hypothetical protein